MDAKCGAWPRRIPESILDFDDDFHFTGSLVRRFSLQYRGKMQELLQEDETKARVRGESRPGRLKQNIRIAEDADVRLYQDYFELMGSVYSEHDFRRRFCMSSGCFCGWLMKLVSMIPILLKKKMLLEN